jgi:hypothetical protein
VAINLDGVSRLSVDAAELLLFHSGEEVSGRKIVVLASGRAGREAVLQAYADRRAQEPFPAAPGPAW